MNDNRDEKRLLLMGEYALIHKSDTPRKLYIPAIQSCVAVIIIVPEKGLCAAHIDNEFHVTATMETMLKKVHDAYGKPLPKGTKAIIIGGDSYEFTGFSSAGIYKPIYKVLEENHIPYTHNHITSHLKALVPSALYSIAWLSNYIGPESTFYAGLVFLGITGISIAIEQQLLSNQNFRVKVDLQTLQGFVKDVPMEKEPALMEKIYTQRTQDHLLLFGHRAKLGPREAKNKDQLPLLDVSSSFKLT